MKKIITLFVILLTGVGIFAQAPQKLSYQCVVRNTAGTLIVNHAVGIRATVLQGSATGTVVYQETFNSLTNGNGLVTIEIGNGTPVSGNFSSINWASGSYYLRTETDPTGGTSYTISGTSQLISVPYALHAKNAASYNETDPVFGAAPAKNITSGNITNWNTSYGWGNHAGLYRPAGWVPAWSDVTGKPVFATVATSGSYNDLINKPTILNSQWTTQGSNIHYSSGNVGIGTNNPIGALEISCNSVDTYPHLLLSEADAYARVSFRTMLTPSKHWVIAGLTSTSDGDSQLHINYNNGTSGKNIFSVFGDSRISIDGNVGIGTTVPSAKLEVAGQLKITGGNPGDGKVLTSNASGLASWQTPYSGPWQLNGSNIYYTNGNVAIGMNFPRYQLTIYNDNNPHIGFYNSTSGTTGTDGFTISTESSGSPVWIWNWENSNMHFGTNNQRRMDILADGRIIMKKSLNINTEGTFGALYVQDKQALWWDGTYFSWGYDAVWNYFADRVSIGRAIDPGGSYMLYVDGTAYTTGTWSSSDASFKKNISTIGNSLDRLMKVRGTRFEFRTDEFKDYHFDNGPQFGLIAQEVEDVFPEVVKTERDGYKSVNYNGIIPVLIEAIKEQQKIIDQLKAENIEMKLNQQTLQDRLSVMENLMNSVQAKLTGLK